MRNGMLTASSPSRRGLRLEIRSISKTIDGNRILDDVSLPIEAGEFVTILGPSGSGKSSLLNVIAGFLAPDAGAIHAGARDITFLSPSDRGLGMVFQSHALFPHMSAGENVAFPLRTRRMAAADIADRVKRALDMVRLSGFEHRDVRTLSGGQQQRVSIARALVFSPQIILMDEPLSALDKGLREYMQIELRRLHQEIGATIVYVTHDQREALSLSDRIAVMNAGRVSQCATPDEIYNNPSSAFVAQFFGESTSLPGIACAGGVTLAQGGFLPAGHAIPIGTACKIVLRSERVRVGDDVASGDMRLAAIVKDIVYQGDSHLSVLELDDGLEVIVRTPISTPTGARAFAIGATTTANFNPATAIVVEA